METQYACITMPLDCNSLIIGGVAQWQTKLHREVCDGYKIERELGLINHTSNSISGKNPHTVPVSH